MDSDLVFGAALSVSDVLGDDPLHLLSQHGVLRQLQTHNKQTLGCMVTFDPSGWLDQVTRRGSLSYWLTCCESFLSFVVLLCLHVPRRRRLGGTLGVTD